MGTAVWHPKWWSQEQHESHWERVKEALKRDWEQTKTDLKGHGRELGQDVDDTVKQAVGKDPIPPRGQPNADVQWDQIVEPLRYGVGARKYYGSQFTTWDDKLETRLKGEWESDTSHGAWNDVKDFVRRGWEKVAG